MAKNWNCEGAHCSSSHGEVRILPTGKDSNAILCHACYLHEIRWRLERNITLDKEVQFRTPPWYSLKVYQP